MLAECITSSEMRALELNAEYFGVSRLVLMENAGRSVAQEVCSRFKPDRSVAVFCGLGGNGGDGFVAARHLCCSGFKVKVLLAGKHTDISDASARQNWNALQSLSETVPVEEVYDSSLVRKLDADIVIDALLGTGAKGSLRPPVLQLVERINDMDAFRIAVDVPTGVDADTGQVSNEAVKADVTVTFHKSKKGLDKARRFVGELVVSGIGLPNEFERYIGPGDVQKVVNPRPVESHKGDFGRLLVVGGSETFSGAPALVAEAAFRAGVDLAYVAAPEKTAYAISCMSPDLITIKLEGKSLNPDNLEVLRSYIEVCDAIVLGPGLGLLPETQKAVRMIVDEAERLRKPLLLDADGLKAFAKFKRSLKVPLVLTPHAGEYAILTGEKPEQVLSERVEQVRRAALRLKATILLKGHVDVVSDGKRVKLNFTGNPGMTVGGTGDVLSGVVGAFLAKKVDGFEASVAGAFVNGAAGDFAFKELGDHMVASDVIRYLPSVLNDPMSHKRVLKARGEAS